MRRGASAPSAVPNAAPSASYGGSSMPAPQASPLASRQQEARLSQRTSVCSESSAGAPPSAGAVARVSRQSSAS